MWRVGLLAGLVGCGRLGFDAIVPIDAIVTPVDTTSTDDALAIDQARLSCDPLPCSDSPRAIMCGTRCFASCEDLMNQAAAAARCTAWGGSLVSIHDMAEQNCINTQIANLISTPLFMGYEQASGAPTPTQSWTWNDGSMTTAFTYWFSSEPNDGTDSLEDGDEQCGTFLGGGRWNDEECNQTRGVVCAR